MLCFYNAAHSRNNNNLACKIFISLNWFLLQYSKILENASTLEEITGKLRNKKPSICSKTSLSFFMAVLLRNYFPYIFILRFNLND